MRDRYDSFTALRDQMRWRFAMVMCVTGMVALTILLVANWRGGRTDSVWLAIVVLALLAACLVMLLVTPRPLGGRIYHWFAVAVLVFLPWFGYIENRTFHYWIYVLPPVLFFLMRPWPALWGMVAFGVYACALLTPFTAMVDIARVASSYLLLVGFLFTYARFEERAGEMLRYHSDHDALSNCLNRRIFNERLQQLTAEGRDGCAFLLLDIDRFKAINDQHGHLVGDRVITQVAAALGRHLAPDVGLYRYGGEEFAVIAPGTDLRAAAALGETLRAAVAATVLPDVAVTISVGVAVWTPGQDTPQHALDEADRRLYAAKRGGRNRVVAESSAPAAVATG
jgi:diguanylate cyclase (GGDEF)-like protein